MYTETFCRDRGSDKKTFAGTGAVIKKLLPGQEMIGKPPARTRAGIEKPRSRGLMISKRACHQPSLSWRRGKWISCLHVLTLNLGGVLSHIYFRRQEYGTIIYDYRDYTYNSSARRA